MYEQSTRLSFWFLALRPTSATPLLISRDLSIYRIRLSLGTHEAQKQVACFHPPATCFLLRFCFVWNTPCGVVRQKVPSPGPQKNLLSKGFSTSWFWVYVESCEFVCGCMFLCVHVCMYVRVFCLCGCACMCARLCAGVHVCACVSTYANLPFPLSYLTLPCLTGSSSFPIART